MKLRSIIALILAMMMIVFIIPGCSKTEKETGKDQPATTQTTPGTSGDTSGEKEEMEISIFHWGLTEFEPSNDDVAKFIKEKFKITFKPVTYDGEDALKLAAASKSLPEVFDTGPLYEPAMFNQWITQGIVRDIPEDLINKYPNIVKHIDNRTAQTAKQIHGKHYMLPRTTSRVTGIYEVSWDGAFYRKDWAQNVGITKVPSTFDEFYEMLKAFKTGDPDQNGKTDTFGMTTNGFGMLTNMFAAWGINFDDWIEEGGKYIPAYMSKKCIEPLKYWQKLFNEGLLDPEFSSNGHVQAMQKFAGNTYGVIVRNSDTYWCYRVIVREYGGANTDKGNPLDVVGVIPTLAKDANSDPLRPEQIDNDAIQFRSDFEDKKLDRFLEFYDWLLTDEATELMNLGFEGTHYSKTPDGKYATFNDPNTGTVYDIRKLFPSTGMISIVSWGFDRDADLNWPSSMIRDDVKILAKELRDARNPYPLRTNLAFAFISTPAKDSLSIDVNADFTNMVMSSENMETQFDRFVQNALNMGVQQAIDETNAEAAKMGIIK